MEATNAQETESIDAVAASNGRPIEVLPTMVRIHDVSIERPGVVAYLETIAPEKQEIALVHALEVGITELVARRARFRPKPAGQPGKSALSTTVDTEDTEKAC